MRDGSPYVDSVQPQPPRRGCVPAGFKMTQRPGYSPYEQAGLASAGVTFLFFVWIPDVKPGHEVEFPAPITVKNGGAGSVTCKIAPIPAVALGIKSMPGYVDIPDPTWCRLESDTLTLDAGESKSVSVSLLVPDEPCYYNRHWIVAFAVRTAGGGAVGAAVFPYVYIETASGTEPIRPPEATGGARALSPDSPRGTDARANAPGASTRTASEIPGCLKITPGTLDAGDVPSGRSKKAGSVSILNELDQDILLSVRSVVPDPTRLARRVLLTPGHMWIRNPDWLQPATRALLLPAGEEARFAVTVASPADSTLINYRWEGFIAINGSDGSQFLVRARWRTTENSGETTEDSGKTTEAPGEADLLSGRRPRGESP
jgi:hypothetical protein